MYFVINEIELLKFEGSY